MIKLQIVEYPNAILRHVSAPITIVNQDIHDLAKAMLELMEDRKGLALAAVQVGVACRMFVVQTNKEVAEPVFINPVISRRRGHKISEEGCLSLPGELIKVSRATVLDLVAYNLEGREISFELDGLMARVVQHEMDHLNGVLIIDKEVQHD